MQNNKINIIKNYFFLCFIILVISNCSPVKYIPENQYLLTKNKIKVDNKDINKSELENYFKQKPNKRIIGYFFHLRLYSLSNINKNNEFNNYLRRIGEEPVIFEPYLARKSSDQFNIYLKNNGYYNALINDTVIYKKKKAIAKYKIKTNDPIKINTIKYIIKDSLISSIVLSDTTNRLIKTGQNFNAEILEKERKRIESLIRSKGYYEFVKQYIYYEADTISKKNYVSLTIDIKNFSFYSDKKEIVQKKHKLYTIKNIYINPSYQPGKSIINKNISNNYLTDTLSYKGMIFNSSNNKKFSKTILSQSIYIEKNSLFNPTDVNQTYLHLSSLKLFKIVDIQFSKISNLNSLSNKDTAILDCHIRLTPSKLQAYSIELEGTNSSGNLGGATNFIYQHKNLFKGFEELNIKLIGSYESITKSGTTNFTNAYSFGSEARIKIHKFLLPFQNEQFIKKYNPKTSIALSFNYQSRPNYWGTIGNFEFGYIWQGNSRISHILNPIEFNIVNIEKSKEFKEMLELPKLRYLKHSYDNHVVPVSSYTFIFNNQNFRKIHNLLFIRYKFETAGKLLQSINKSFGNNDSTIFGTKFSQFLKTDFEIRFHKYISNTNKLAFRFFAGVGYPYGNSLALPFEKKYFSGGANSLRAWKLRTVGPGSYDNSNDISDLYPNQDGDFKLEGNIEYRFDMFWKLEGAFFIDAGNIWAITINDDRENSLFKTNSFYNDIAVGSGFGLRFDFSYFLIRADLGIKLRDPAIQGADKWIINNQLKGFKKFNPTIGIGYPF